MGYISPKSLHTKHQKTIFVRTAERKDGRAMHALTKDVLLEQKGLIMTVRDFTMSVDDQRKRNELFLEHPQTIALIAEHDKQIIGIVTIEPEHLLKTAHRGNLGIIIHRSFRSQGVGKMLMNIAINWAMNNNYYEKLELEVLETNKLAIGLYENIGFIHEGVIRNAVKHNEYHYENLLKMGLLLS